MQNRRFVFAVVGFYLLTLGVLTGMLIEKVQFDITRSVLLAQLDRDTHTLHQRLMAMEREIAVERKVNR